MAAQSLPSSVEVQWLCPGCARWQPLDHLCAKGNAMDVKLDELAGGRALLAETPTGGFVMRIVGGAAAGDYRAEDTIPGMHGLRAWQVVRAWTDRPGRSLEELQAALAFIEAAR